jgi:SAM-dependent methyltransferase
MTGERESRFEEGWRRRFENFAALRDDDAGIAGWSEGGLAARFRQFVALWQAAGGAPAGRVAWLDAGCGAGTYARFLASQSLAVTAVDYSEVTTRKARDRSPGPIDWAVADTTQLPFATGSLDGALCFGVMQALAAPERALHELRRVLRPGAALWVDALNAQCLPTLIREIQRRRSGRPPHLRYDEPGTFRRALEASGFAGARLHWIPVLPERLRRLQPVMEGGVMRALMRVPPFGRVASHSFLFVANAV